MPILETPPSAAPTTGVPPPPMPDRPRRSDKLSGSDQPGRSDQSGRSDRSSGRIRAGRFGELDHSELVHLLDSLDDERAKARFRESVYISLFFWMAVIVLLIFAPRIFPRRPEFVQPSDLSKQMTRLNVPLDVQRAIDRAPKIKTPRAAGSTKAIEQPRQLLPEAPAPQPAQQQPPQQPRPPAPPAAPPPVVQQSPLQQPRPQQNTAALPSAPAPSQTPARSDFGNPNTSAREMVQQASRAPRGSGGLTIGGDPNGPVSQRGMATGAQILSDTLGVDFDPYLEKILREIRETWYPLIPEEARPPLNKQGETQIRFTILPDGSIGGMTLEWSTHDDAINHSCWGSITGVGQFPPLPKQFHGPNLELRIHYLVNKEPR